MKFKDFCKQFGTAEFSEPWQRGSYCSYTVAQQLDFYGFGVVMVTHSPHSCFEESTIKFELNIVIHKSQIELFKKLKCFKNIKFTQCYYGSPEYVFIETTRPEKVLFELLQNKELLQIIKR